MLSLLRWNTNIFLMEDPFNEYQCCLKNSPSYSEFGKFQVFCKLYLVFLTVCSVGFERDEVKVPIKWGIKGQGINIAFPFTLYYQGGGVLPLSRWQ